MGGFKRQELRNILSLILQRKLLVRLGRLMQKDKHSLRPRKK